MKKNIPLSELAALVQGEVVGDGAICISGLSGIDQAEKGEITFLVKSSQCKYIEETRASAVIVPLDVQASTKPLIRVKSPYLASAIIHNYLLAEPFQAKGIHARACVGDNFSHGEQLTIEAMAVLGDNVTLGERVRICSGAYVGDNAVLGDDCIIHPNVTIEEGTVLGNRVVIHGGTVIGSDGYGYAPDARGCHIKRPQVGTVRIDDDVEIGANCCVDRAAFGVTWIKTGTKIDNMVQIAHNVVVGENCLLVSHAAVAGSTSLGRNVVLGGKASAVGHITLGDGAIVAAKGAATSSVAAGKVIAGTPGIPHRQWTKSSVLFRKLPEMREEFRRLRKEVDELKEILSVSNEGETHE